VKCGYVRFDFTGRSVLPLRRHAELTVTAGTDGCCDAVLMWWELDMVDSTRLILSTAPYWAHPTPHDIQVSTVTILYHGPIPGVSNSFGGARYQSVGGLHCF